MMVQANPALTPNAVKAILQYTASTAPNTSPLEQGAGFLNVQGAVQLARFFATAREGDAYPGRCHMGPTPDLGQLRRGWRRPAAGCERVGHEHRVGLEHRLGLEHRVGLEHRLGIQPGRGCRAREAQHRLGQFL